MPPTPVSSGRFVPGTRLSDRYRIVALQGRAVFAIPHDEPAGAVRDETPISQRETAAT